jgi:hypothetical protein
MLISPQWNWTVVLTSASLVYADICREGAVLHTEGRRIAHIGN